MSFGGYMILEDVEQIPSWSPQLSANFQLKDTVTANPSTDLITCASNHDQIAREVVLFTTTGTLPSPLVPFAIYRVLTTGLTTTSFKLGSNIGWNPPPEPPPIDITDSGTGIHTLWTRPFEIVGTITAVNTSTEVITSSTRTFFHSDVNESDRVRFSGGTLPVPLVAGTDYYIVIGSATDRDFKVALGGGSGTVVDLTVGNTGSNILAIRGTTSVQYPAGELGYFGFDSAYMFGDTINIITGGGGALGEGGEPLMIELPRPTIRVRDPELASLLRRARRAARTIENMTIIGASGDSEGGFNIND